MNNNKIKKILLSKINKLCTFSNSKNSLDDVAKKLANETIIIEYIPSKTDKINVEDGLKLRQLCSLFNSILIVKNRFDIAKIIQADGIILNNKSIQSKYFNYFFDENNYIGYEINSNEELIDLKFEIFDFIKFTTEKINKNSLETDIKFFNQQTL